MPAPATRVHSLLTELKSSAPPNFREGPSQARRDQAQAAAALRLFEGVVWPRIPGLPPSSDTNLDSVGLELPVVLHGAIGHTCCPAA